MCYAIIKLTSRNGENAGYIEVALAEDFDNKIAELTDRPGIVSLAVFIHTSTTQRVEQWQTTSSQSTLDVQLTSDLAEAALATSLGS